jgi:hypothetical protein
MLSAVLEMIRWNLLSNRMVLVGGADNASDTNSLVRVELVTVNNITSKYRL